MNTKIYKIEKIKKTLKIASSTLLLITFAYSGWFINDWVDKRDQMLIQIGYDKAIDQINLENK